MSFISWHLWIKALNFCCLFVCFWARQFSQWSLILAPFGSQKTANLFLCAKWTKNKGGTRTPRTPLLDPPLPYTSKTSFNEDEDGRLFLWRLSSHRNFFLSQSQREEAKKFAEIKRKLRLEIQEVRETVLQIMRENQEAPELERLDRHEYNLDVDRRQKLVLEGEEKIKQVWASNFKSQKQILVIC